MKEVDKAIVLSRIPYSDSSLIVKLFTQQHGVNSFMFQGARKKSGNLLFPLAVIEANYYKHKNSHLLKLTGVEHIENGLELISNPVKSSIAFFIAELIAKLAPENQANPSLFQFIHQEVTWLIHSHELSNYILWFIARLSELEGIQPSNSNEKVSYFDYKESQLTHQQPLHPYFDHSDCLNRIQQSLTLDKTHFLALSIPKEERNMCLQHWMNYFAFQHNGVFSLKSLEVVRTVLND